MEFHTTVTLTSPQRDAGESATPSAPDGALVQAFVDGLPDAAFIADDHHRIVYCNRAYARLEETTPEALIDRVWTERLAPDERAKCEAENRSVVLERRVITSDGAAGAEGCASCLLTHRFPVVVDPDVFVGVVCVDVSSIRQIEHELHATIEAKQRLMDELNHRVKNNLAMVDALIRLKDDSLGDAADLTDIANQVRAIAVIHDRLHQDGGVTTIDLEPYIGQLLAEAFSFFAGPPVHVFSSIDAVHLPTKAATHVGLIVNELATNAIKHGFSDTANPEFRLTLIRDGTDLVLIAYNNGEPFPDDIDLNAPDSLGLALVSSIVTQLHGTMHVSGAPHPRFTIRFPGPI